MTPRDAHSPYAVTIAGRRFYVYANDHAPPHAHVRLLEDERMLLVDVRTGEPLPPGTSARNLRAWRQIRPHVLPHLPKLLAEFERLNPQRKEPP